MGRKIPMERDKVKEIIKECTLLDEQRKEMLQGIKQGKERFNEVVSIIGSTATEKNKPFLQYDLINTEVKGNIIANPHLNMDVYTKRAGFHPYIVCHDVLRNIFVLVLKLPVEKELFNPSGYRGDFASSNVDRLLDMGMSEADLPKDYLHQYSLSLGEENQPFGIIVCYDGKKDVVFEGALRPDQQDWLYKEEITNFSHLENEDIGRLRTQRQDEVELPLKENPEKEEIILKLKN